MKKDMRYSIEHPRYDSEIRSIRLAGEFICFVIKRDKYWTIEHDNITYIDHTISGVVDHFLESKGFYSRKEACNSHTSKTIRELIAEEKHGGK